MSIYCSTDPPELALVIERIRQKKEDYERYAFNHMQGRALRAFFDLAQEYETLENFYPICVFVPKVFLGFDSRLYMVDPETGRLWVACDSINGYRVCGTEPPKYIRLVNKSYEFGDSFIAPIRGNRRLISSKPINKGQDIIGMFETFPLSKMTDKDKLFFEKYANRIGYNLHYKLLATQNVEHIKFINTLVADIEHNVIVPNMRYKVFFKILKKKIDQLHEIRRQLDEHITFGQSIECPHVDQVKEIRDRLEELNQELLNQYEEVERHYQNTSLFLESLLRRDHFEKGHLVLRRRSCRLIQDVLYPQLDRYRSRLERRNIKIKDNISKEFLDDLVVSVDVGLMSQVFANFFSNAEKYTEEVVDENGNKTKFMEYGFEVIRDYFGPHKDGILFYVYTTGPKLDFFEQSHIFDEGFRAKLHRNRQGSGHGLHFVKKVIEVHGGRVGFRLEPLGNCFYFVLPFQEQLNLNGKKQSK